MGRFINQTTGAIVSVADEKDYRFGDGWKPAGDSTRSDTPDSSWKVADLKAFAEDNGIDLLDAKNKGDILAAIDLHNEES